MKQASKVKSTKSGDDQHDTLVGCMVEQEEMVIGLGFEKNKIHIQAKIAPKYLEFFKTDDSDDSERNNKNLWGKIAQKSPEFVGTHLVNDEEKEPVVKKATK